MTNLIKYCCKQADGWEVASDGAIVSPAGSHYYPGLLSDEKGFNGKLSVDEMWGIDYFPLLVTQACDSLGISINYDSKPERGWSYCINNDDTYSDSWDRGEFYETANEARIAAIKHCMEVEGDN